MADKKELPLALLEILTKYTDHDHYLSTAEMTEILHSEYGLTLERRTLYSNMDLLKKYGHKISTWKDNGYGYCLTEHQSSKVHVSKGTVYNVIQKHSPKKKNCPEGQIQMEF